MHYAKRYSVGTHSITIGLLLVAGSARSAVNDMDFIPGELLNRFVYGTGATEATEFYPMSMVPDHRFDAICIIANHTLLVNDIRGSGFYIGEDANGDHWVVCASHSFHTDNPPASNYSVYFKRLPMGYGDNGCVDNTVLASFYEVEIDTYILYPGQDVALIKLDMSSAPSGLSHIDPLPIWTQLPPSSMQSMTTAEITEGLRVDPTEAVIAGWGRVGTSGPSNCNQLRYGQIDVLCVDPIPTGLDYVQHKNLGEPHVTYHDSGSPYFVFNELGQMGVSGHVVWSQSLNDIPAYYYRRNDAYPFIIDSHPALWELDVTGNVGSDMSTEWVTDTGSTDPLRADGTLDLNDAVYVRARTAVGDSRFDLDVDTNVDDDDWDWYVNEVQTQDNIYGDWPTLPLRADMTDLNGDGRLNEADADKLRDDITNMTTSLTQDFNQSGTVTEADALILDAVIEEFGHGYFGDLDGDTDVDSADMTLLRAHASGSGGAFHAQVRPDSDYRIELDWDTDGDNELSDALAFRRLYFPGDLVSSSLVDSYYTARDSYIPDWTINLDDLRALLTDPNSYSGRDIQLLDVSGSDNPSDPEYALPSQTVDMEDLWRILLSMNDPISSETGLGGPVFMAPYDPNEDSRFNWQDIVDYYNHYGTTDTTYIDNFDTNGDDAIDVNDAINLATIMADNTVKWDSFPGSLGGGTLWSYNHGVAGDYDGDCEGLHDANGCCMTFTATACSFCGTNDLAAVSVDTVPDCDDRDAMETDMAGGVILFNGARVGKYDSMTGETYYFVLDYDLDGDNDMDDKVEIYRLIEPADLNGDGKACSADWSLWLAAYNSNDPLADTNRNGTVEMSDYTLYIAFISSPNCTNTCP